MKLRHPDIHVGVLLEARTWVLVPAFGETL